MADSADDLLERVRHARAAPGAAADAFKALDALLSAGGPLPAAWADCDVPARPVINVVGHAFASAVPPGLEIAPGAYSAVVGDPGATLAEARAAEMEHRYDQLTLEVARLTAERDEARAEISRLTAELDATRNVPVEYVITAGLEAAMAADPHREDGAVIRTTDGKREAWAWKAATKEWEQIH